MKRIEARDITGRIMAIWPMDESDRAQRLVSLSEAPWTIGVSEFESEAEADARRLNWLQDHGLPNVFWDGEWIQRCSVGAPEREISLRSRIDTARNAPKPTFTPIETDTKPK